MGVDIDAGGTIRHHQRASVAIECPITLPADITVGAGGIGTTELADLAVTTGKIAALAVTTAKIAALAVTAAELAAGAVTTAKILAGNVTLPKIAVTGIKTLRFDGRNGAGAITLTGAAVGDRVVAIWGNSITAADGTTVVGTIPTQFEAAITVVNQIQQADVADLTGFDYVVILFPATA